MKKLILLVALIVAIGVTTWAQDYVTNLPVGVTYKRIETAKTLTNTDTCDIYFNVQSHSEFKVDAGVNLDLTSGVGTATNTIYIDERKSDDQAWSNVTSTAGLTVSTTTVVATDADAVRARQIRLRIITTGTCVAVVDWAWLKIWN